MVLSCPVQRYSDDASPRQDFKPPNSSIIQNIEDSQVFSTSGHHGTPLSARFSRLPDERGTFSNCEARSPREVTDTAFLTAFASSKVMALITNVEPVMHRD